MADFPTGGDTSVFAAQLNTPRPGMPGLPDMIERSFSTQPKIGQGEARVLRQRMLVAEQHYEKCFRANYKHSLKLLKGKQWPAGWTNSTDNWIVINYLRHIIETQVASTCFNPAEIITRPKSPLGAENEETAKQAVSYEYRESNAQRECKRAYKDSRMFGFGIVMTGWEFQVEDQPEIEGRQTVEGEVPSPDEISQMVEGGASMAPPTVPRSKVLKDGCFARRLDPRTFRISPEASWVIDDAPYCGYVELKEVSEVKADPRYKNTKNLRGSTENLKGYFSDEYQKTPENELPLDVKRVKLHHYFEKRRRLHIVFCDEHEKPLLTEKWYWNHKRYPFRAVFGPHDEDEFYPLPPPMEWEHMQREINLTRSQLANVRQAMVPKHLAVKGVLTEQGKKQVRSGVIGTVIEVNALTAAGSVTPLPLPQLSPDMYQDAHIALSDLGTISTLDQYALGQAPSKRLTTSEVTAISGAGGPRREADRQAFEELCAGVATDFLELLQQYAEVARALPIYDDQQRVVDWKNFTKQQIQGEYDLEIYVGSTEIKNQQGRVEEIGFLLQSLMPYVQAGVIDPKPLIEQLLASMPDIKNVQAITNPPPPPPPPGMPPDGMPPGGPGRPEDQMIGSAGPPGMEGGPPAEMNGGAPPGLSFPSGLLARLGGGMPPQRGGSF